METKQITELIGTFGFPIFIAVYLLWERHAVAAPLIDALKRLILLLEIHERDHHQDKEL